MKYETFKIELKARLEKQLDTGIEVFFNTIEKNNNRRKEVITFREEGINMMPAVHLKDLFDDFAENGDMEQTLGIVLQALKTKGYIDGAELIGVWETVKEQVQIRIINYEWNQEMLQNVPHRKYLDLAIVFQFKLYRENYGVATVLIDYNIMKRWEITEEQLYEFAYQNLNEEEYTIKCMSQILSEILYETKSAEKEDEVMYVMTNGDGCFGAAGLLRSDLLKEFADKIQGNFYILPSSVHELIFVKDNQNLNKEELREMVTEINETTIEEAERLTNNVFVYNRGVVQIAM